VLKILVINPGSTSTKIALFEDELQLWSETQRYETEELDLYPTMEEQESFRFGAISRILEEQGVALSDLDAVVGRGGLLRPLEGGTYKVSKTMIAELLSCEWGTHASNLGGSSCLSFCSSGGK
jgi:Butyrate kinase